MQTCNQKSQYENIGTHTAIRILGSGHCGGVGAQRFEIKKLSSYKQVAISVELLMWEGLISLLHQSI